MSPRPTFHLAGYVKQTFLGGGQAIPPPPTDREFPVARVDPWPLSLSPTSSPRRFQSTKLVHSPTNDAQDDVFSGQHPPSSQAFPTEGFRRPETNGFPSSTITSSPRKRQAHARQKARVIEESKLQPALLQELQSFLFNELQQLEEPVDGAPATDDRKDPTTLRRLQVFRVLFQRLIDAFSVYAPLLTLIRDEYERVISVLRARCEQLPRLRSQLQTFETQCLQEISLHSLEERARVLALKKQLKHTQGRLTACAAQNASLREQIGLLQRDIAHLETRSDGLQLSNHTLVSSIKRHDETLQQVHQRSVDEGQALQQVTQKYYHACDEITELKKTITHLEEKVDGVQVAADKATIALLTKELQDLHSATRGAASTIAPSATDNNGSFAAKTHAALNSAFVRAFQTVGMSITLPALLELVASGLTSCSTSLASVSTSDHCSVPARSDTGFEDAIIKTAQAIRLKLLQLKQLQSALAPPQDEINGSTVGATASEGPVVFLTEPPEQDTSSLSNEKRVESSLRVIQALGPLCILVQDYLPCRGVDPEVPEHLRFDGVVRNLHFSLETVEQLIVKVWDLQDEIAKARAKSGSVAHNALPTTIEPQGASSIKEVDPRLRTRSLPLPPLRAVLVSFLHRSCAPKTEMAETSYNLVSGLARFASISSDCRLFQLVLEREAPDDARHDRDREISALHDTLVAIDRERQSGFQPAPPLASNTSAVETAEDAIPHGCVSVADIIRSLRLLFPWKTDASLSQLHRALLQEIRGCHYVDYVTLLRHHSHSSPSAKSGESAPHKSHATRARFVECLKSQYVDDIVDYRRYLQQQITRELINSQGTDAAVLAQNATTPVGTAESPREAIVSDASFKLPDNGVHMISLLVLRQCIQRCDPAKTVYDIATILSAVSGLSATQILTQDDTMVDGRYVINCLPTLLVRPSGRFARSAASETT